MTSREEFIKDFQEVLKKHNVEIQIEEDSQGYYTTSKITADNISRKDWENTESFEIDFGTFIDYTVEGK